MLVGRRFGMYTPTSSDYNRNVIPSYNTTLACLYKCCQVVCKQGNIVILRLKLVLGTPQSGTLILKRNGVYSQSFNSGRVVVYGVGSPTSSTRFWGNVCRRTAFNTNAAHVICHQLTYSGASTWSYAAIDS